MKASGSAKPYPWSELEAVRADDVSTTRALGRWTGAMTRPEAIAPELGAILGAKVTCHLKRVRCVTGAGRTVENGTAVIVAGADTVDERGGEVMIEIDAPLAARVLAAVVKRAPPMVIAPSPPSVEPSTPGVLAAVIAAVLRRTHAGRAVRVVAAGPALDLARDFAPPLRELIEARFTVVAGDEAFDARVLVPRAIAEAAPERPFSRADLRAMGDVALPIPVVASAAWATAAEVGSLRRGDVWLPGNARVERTATGNLKAIKESVTLAAPTHEWGWRATLGEDGRLVLGDGMEALARETMSGENDTQRDALAEAVGEVPVVVRVEIGSVELRAREWAALGAGDIVALGRKIGEGVTLRVGGVTVARGELVTLDGEVGVRILGRTEGS